MVRKLTFRTLCIRVPRRGGRRGRDCLTGAGEADLGRAVSGVRCREGRGAVGCTVQAAPSSPVLSLGCSTSLRLQPLTLWQSPPHPEKRRAGVLWKVCRGASAWAPGSDSVAPPGSLETGCHVPSASAPCLSLGLALRSLVAVLGPQNLRSDWEGDGSCPTLLLPTFKGCQGALPTSNGG